MTVINTFQCYKSVHTCTYVHVIIKIYLYYNRDIELHVCTCTVTIYRAVNYNWSPFVCLIEFSLCILVGRIGLAVQFRLQLIIHNDIVMIIMIFVVYNIIH